MTIVQEKVLKYKSLRNKPWVVAKLTSVKTGYVRAIFNKFDNNK